MHPTTLHIPGATLLAWAAVAQREDLDTIARDLQRSCLDPAIQEFTTVPKNYTLAMAFEFLRTDAVRWAIMAEDRYSGNIEVREDGDGYSVGYNLAPWARGNGFMRAALMAVARFCQDQGVHRLKVEVSPANVASQHVVEAAGGVLVRRAEMLEYQLCVDA